MLEVRQLGKSFGGFRAVDAVSITIQEHELSSIIGPNGAGKSTLFNLLSGVLRADFGKIIFCGEDITTLSSPEICRRGLVKSFQVTQIFPRLSALKNVQVAMQVNRKKSLNFFSQSNKVFQDEALEILKTVGLAAHAESAAGFLSHGDQKLLDLAICLASEPRLLLLDEPTAGLGPKETATTVDLIQRLNRERGLTIMFTEHDMTIVLGISQRITVMHQGRIIVEGRPDEIRGNEQVHRIYFGE